MASSYLHCCPACGFEIEAWDDGHPYIRDDRGRARFYYHPREMEGRREILASCRWAADKSEAELARLLEENPTRRRTPLLPGHRIENYEAAP